MRDLFTSTPDLDKREHLRDFADWAKKRRKGDMDFNDPSLKGLAPNHKLRLLRLDQANNRRDEQRRQRLAREADFRRRQRRG